MNSRGFIYPDTGACPAELTETKPGRHFHTTREFTVRAAALSRMALLQTGQRATCTLPDLVVYSRVSSKKVKATLRMVRDPNTSERARKQANCHLGQSCVAQSPSRWKCRWPSSDAIVGAPLWHCRLPSHDLPHEAGTHCSQGEGLSFGLCVGTAGHALPRPVPSSGEGLHSCCFLCVVLTAPCVILGMSELIRGSVSSLVTWRQSRTVHFWGLPPH